MRIAHYHHEIRLEAGGVVRAVLDFCTGLGEAGHEVILLSPDITDAPDAWKTRSGSPRAIEVPRRNRVGLHDKAALRALQGHLAGADVLHLHGMWGVHNLQLARIARRLGVPYVYSVHGMLDDWSMAQRGPKKRLYMALFGRRMLHGAAAIHCTAEAELTQARKWFPRAEGAVVPLIFDLASFRDLPGPDPARARFPVLTAGLPTLLFLSRIHYKKGIEVLVRAAAKLKADGRPAAVLIVGSGEEAYEQSLRALADDLDVADVVHFLGFVSGVEKVSLYQAADVFVLPTSQENFGFVLFEALAAGTPVLTTRGTDTWPEMEASGGAVIAPAEPAAMAEAAAALIDDDDRRAAMGASGRAWVLAHLDPAAVVRGYEALYERAAGGGRGSADA